MTDIVDAKDNELFHDQLFDITSYVLDNDKSITQEIAKVHQNNDYSWFYEQSDMSIPEELPHIMASATPPPFSFFQNLPCVMHIGDREYLRQHMIVYCTTLEKPGCRPRIGVGSAAQQIAGADRRIQHYRQEKTLTYSVKTRESLKDGYKITNVGLLVAIKRPAVELCPRIRAWALTLETDFTFLFSSMWDRNGGNTSDSMRHACPWDIGALEYDGVNTHSPLKEHVKDLEFSGAELRAMAVLRQERLRERMYLYVRTDKYKENAPRKYLSWRQSPAFKSCKARENAKQYESRQVLKKVEAGELELDEEVQKQIGSALRHRVTTTKYTAKNKVRDGNSMKASRALVTPRTVSTKIRTLHVGPNLISFRSIYTR
ncbi:carbamoyl-phosphate synthase (glutamine-hydrolyzing) cpa2 [Exophiala xenobiotica]|uniref:Carbamoyl-phosphate synthase (Glutamine-hydrolyzing) cpa2 n=1 Tax=Lithohypha guttulata TaxID=1690604 RepID=A0ABR0KCC4_9EURO|nr:carbamoyl-phosphate synthase (glutamine-hydrolyzing) cpa2 [Lithohypha guttulata]KAK5319375.1 carbamoyl-phosphate synthase (glutamine-hydrolyzing) cpa2 [Exophiala xenobiotica]